MHTNKKIPVPTKPELTNCFASTNYGVGASVVVDVVVDVVVLLVVDVVDVVLVEEVVDEVLVEGVVDEVLGVGSVGWTALSCACTGG